MHDMCFISSFSTGPKRFCKQRFFNVFKVLKNSCKCVLDVFILMMNVLAHNAFVRTNRRAIAMMFVRLFVRLSVCPSVCLSRTSVHCNHTVHFSADLSSLLDSPMFWAPWHQSIPQPSFSISTWKRGGISVCKLGEALNANNDKQVMRRWI